MTRVPNQRGMYSARLASFVGHLPNFFHLTRLPPSRAVDLISNSGHDLYSALGVDSQVSNRDLEKHFQEANAKLQVAYVRIYTTY